MPPPCPRTMADGNRYCPKINGPCLRYDCVAFEPVRFCESITSKNKKWIVGPFCNAFNNGVISLPDLENVKEQLQEMNDAVFAQEEGEGEEG